MVNVVPVNDDKEHSLTQECWCNPKVNWIDSETNLPFPNGPMIVHNSSDQREFVEQALLEGMEDKPWAIVES